MDSPQESTASDQFDPSPMKMIVQSSTIVTVTERQTPKNFTSPVYGEYDYDPSNLTSEEYLDQVFNYIYPAEYEWVLVVLSFLVLFVGLLGNFLVCYVVYKNYTMQTVTNIFIVNLAVADFCVLLFCLPPTTLWDITETWFIGNVPCKLILYLQTVSVSVSVLTLTAISVDRWYAICTPLKFKATPGRAKWCTLFIWFISIILDLPEAFHLNTHPYKFKKDVQTIYLTNCIPSWEDAAEQSFVLAKFTLLFLIPMLFMTVTYVQIIRVLWKQDSPDGAVRSMISPATEMQIRSRRKAAKMLVAVVVMFGLFYLPVHLISIGRIFIDLPNNDVNIIISQLSHLLIYANSAINPLIYNFMSGKFRREFRKAMFCIKTPEDKEPKLHYRTTSTRTHRV